MNGAFQLDGLDAKKAHWIDGKPHFTGKAIGEFLGSKLPELYVDQIVRRHRYINCFRTTIKLKSDDNGTGKMRNVKVYDPIGVQLIIFQSALPKAVSHRVNVARFVSAYLSNSATAP